MPLKRRGGPPLYQQLYALLRTKVQRGEWPASSMIPPESRLMDEYGVSRITVRSALDRMVREGLIVRQRGRGSFVRSSEPDERACVVSLTEQVLRSGRTPTTDVVGVVVARSDAFAEATLPFERDERVARVERVRRIDGRPVALMRSFIPERMVPGIEASHFAEQGPAQSLLFVLENSFGLLLGVGEETLIPRLVTAHEASLLEIENRAAVAVKVCRIDNADGVTTLFEEAVWCAPQTQPIQRRPQAVLPPPRRELARHAAP